MVKKIQINMSNKSFYSLIVFGVLILAGIGVYAYGTSNPAVFGHSAGEIEGLGELLIPSGAVMAFNLASCPSGWSTYASAKDRVIVGSGSSYSLGKKGGAKTHTLTIAEMPKHRHAYTNAGNFGGGGKHYPSGYSPQEMTYTDYVGGNQPHNNMQPYIALLYCQKN